LVTRTIVVGIYPPMGAATPEFYRQVLQESFAIIEAAGADYLLIGSLATRALLDMPPDEKEDIDALVRLNDAEKLLDAFAKKGYATYRRDPRWIFKAARPDVTVDLIFRAGERIEIDDEHLAHSTTVDVEGVPLRLPGPEDLIIMKAVFDGPDRPGRWYDALKLMRHLPIDWEYLARRGTELAPRRVLSLLLYATDAGVGVPGAAVSALVPSAPEAS
jgi:hypothetical protein